MTEGLKAARAADQLAPAGRAAIMLRPVMFTLC